MLCEALCSIGTWQTSVGESEVQELEGTSLFCICNGSHLRAPGWDFLQYPCQFQVRMKYSGPSRVGKVLSVLADRCSSILSTGSQPSYFECYVITSQGLLLLECMILSGRMPRTCLRWRGICAAPLWTFTPSRCCSSFWKSFKPGSLIWRNSSPRFPPPVIWT